MTSYAVEIYLYDLSGGWLQNNIVQLVSPVSEILHSGVVVHGREYLYGRDGLESQKPDLLKTVKRKVRVGQTYWTKEQVESHIEILKTLGIWTGERYDPVNYNCHHFSDTFVKDLCGLQAQLPQEVYEFNKKIRKVPKSVAQLFGSSSSSYS